MITLDHPLVAAYLAAPPGRLGPADHAILVDQLQDAGCDLAGMLLLYAGTSEGRYTDGLPREILVAFVRTVGGDAPAREVLAVPRLVPVLPSEVWQVALRELPGMVLGRISKCLFVGYRRTLAFCPCLDGPPPVATFRPGPAVLHKQRVTRVELLAFRWDEIVPLVPGPEGRASGPVAPVYHVGACPVCGRVYWSKDDHGPEVRDQKRRVLALFPGVEVVTREWRPRVLRKKHRCRDVTDPAAYGNVVMGVEVLDSWLEVDGERVDLPVHIDESVRPPHVTKRVPARDLVPPEHLIPGGLPE